MFESERHFLSVDDSPSGELQAPGKQCGGDASSLESPKVTPLPRKVRFPLIHASPCAQGETRLLKSAHCPAQHLHYMVAAPGHRTLVTESYFATDPFFEGNIDRNWNKQGIAEHKEMILPVSLFEDASVENHSMHAAITLDIVLEKT
jgi:Dioxygenase